VVYRLHAGWLLGHRFCQLAHLGRSSGARYTTVLEVLSYDPACRELVVMAGFGRGSDWYRNVHANGFAEITIGRQSFRAEQRELDIAEAAAALERYEQRNRFAAPVVRGVLSRLLGWRYDSSDASRRRAVQELPLLAFRQSDRR
jgi:deazaflavin-dependent oxidoreductase (nitroreductase family)